MPTKDISTKHAALKLVSRGLTTQSEAAMLAGITRQLMRYWCSDIDVEKARNEYLWNLWRKTVKRSAPRS